MCLYLHIFHFNVTYEIMVISNLYFEGTIEIYYIVLFYTVQFFENNKIIY